MTKNMTASAVDDSNPFLTSGTAHNNVVNLIPGSVTSLDAKRGEEGKPGGNGANCSDKAKLAAPQYINDAIIIGELTIPEVDAFLNTEIDIIWSTSIRANGGKEKNGKKGKTSYVRYNNTVGGFIYEGLSSHPVDDKIDGVSFVYNRGKLFGGTATMGERGYDLAYRTANTAEAITALVIDVDEGDTVERVIGELADQGLLCVVFTSYSHTTKGIAGSDRFRIVVLMDKPYELPMDGDERRQALNLWKRKYVGFCESIGVTTFDTTGMEVARIQRPPRRPKDAEFKHYIIAGVGLDLANVAEGDPSKYGAKEVVRRSGCVSAASNDNEGDAILHDGFNGRDWHNDIGRYCSFGDVLDMIGWETRSGDGDEREIMCPNDSAHSNAGDPEDTACWMKADGDDVLISCRHNSCTGIHTWDMIMFIDAAIVEGHVALPNGYASLSDVLCDSTFYPDEIDGIEVELSKYEYGVEEPVPEILSIKTVATVRRSLKVLCKDKSPTDVELAALFAGVQRGGNKVEVMDALVGALKDGGLRKGNDITSLRKQGKNMREKQVQADVAKKQVERAEVIQKALSKPQHGDESLDPTDPLGDTVEAALSTMARRYAIVDANGKFRVFRRPNLDAFTSVNQDPTMIAYSKQDFVDLHRDRQIMVDNRMINPADLFIDHVQRKAGMMFGPPPVVVPKNILNLYQGRYLESEAGEWETIKTFIKYTVCAGDEEKYRFLMLWMAHMVQVPGEIPGTAVVLRGEGGTGKSTFGDLLMKLTFPHCKQIEKESHVLGNHAGEHLSKVILMVVTEAVFGASPKVTSELKSMVTSPTMQVEAKYMNLTTAQSFIRMFIDSNSDIPVRIDMDGSERRWFVMEIDNRMKGDKAYFNELRDAIDGDEIAAFLAYLEIYNPADHGYTWSDVKKAPATAERVTMQAHSLSAVARRLDDVLQDGGVTMWVDGEMASYPSETDLKFTDGLRVPEAAFKEHLRNGERSGRIDLDKMLQALRPGAVLKTGKGRVGDRDNGRWVEFPAGVLGPIGKYMEDDVDGEVAASP